MIKLIENELLKIVRKRKMVVVILIMAVLISMFTYAQYREQERIQETLGTRDWRTTLQQDIINKQNRLSSTGISEEWRKQLKISVEQQQYYLDHDINPTEPGAPTFVREFLQHAIQLLLPLLVMIISADIVSSEHSAGTVKLLLTRPVKRWRILLSKYITLILSVSFLIMSFAVLSYLISGLVFGFSGWSAPVLTGFLVENGELSTEAVHLVPQWEFLLMVFGLAWFVSLVVGTLSFMLSSLIKSTAAGMGVMLACLIAGMILTNMVSSWESAKYLFMVNLTPTIYLTGGTPPIEGMTLGFSLMVLLIWGVAGIAISFITFTRKDIF
ncbi:ABC transporter permease subunit [Neobacillus sp. LXY-4]|uniref:ABC transporter permease subunit n=1 Tax=Neobacillus sp. LXY-4 TaxID=3379826 RepID=UPI003EE33724